MPASVSKTCPLPCSLRVSECSKIWFIKQKNWSDGLQRHQYNVKHKTISLGVTDPRSVLFNVWWLVLGAVPHCHICVSHINVFKANMYTVVGHHTVKLKPELLA